VKDVPLTSAGAARAGTRLTAEGKRERILDAMIEVVGERGFRGASVASVSSRAAVSNGTFYKQFEDLEDCFLAVLDLGRELSGAVIVQAFAAERSWRDGVRAALAALLEFFDAEPDLRQVCFQEVLAAGSWALEHHERNLAALQEVILGYWAAAGAGEADPVIARGVVASTLGLITTHVVTRRTEPLIVLLAPLTSLVVTPFLDADAIKHDVDRAARLTETLLSERYPLPPRSDASAARIPAELQTPRASRAREALLYIAERSDEGSTRRKGPSNTEIAIGIGVSHQSQMSKLLARLERIGLLVKDPGSPGNPNAWSLTCSGRNAADVLKERQSSSNLV
jgi:AcrR family transcriptional regulator